MPAQAGKRPVGGALLLQLLWLPAGGAFVWAMIARIREDFLAGGLVFVPYGNWADAIVPGTLLAVLAFVVRHVSKRWNMMGRGAAIILSCAVAGVVLMLAGGLLIVPATASFVLSQAGYARCAALDGIASSGKTTMAVWAPGHCPESLSR